LRGTRFTAWDADGGFAEYCTVPEDFAYVPLRAGLERRGLAGFVAIL
jgi:threonine dehydrogenase-like Zn-dependent dehydrogenase